MPHYVIPDNGSLSQGDVVSLGAMALEPHPYHAGGGGGGGEDFPGCTEHIFNPIVNGEMPVSP